MKKLITGEALLETLFEPDARPSIFWLRDQRRAGRIPFLKIGGKVVFDVDVVRLKLEQFKRGGDR